jgi:hypothetical protein
MNRRTILSLATLVTGSATVPQSAFAQTANFESGGLGLQITDWEDQFGLGEAGQTYLSFELEDGNFWVGVASDSRAIDYIERNYADSDGVALAVAQEEAGGLLPGDARLQETYIANYAEILHGTLVDRYQSRGLAAQFSSENRRYTRFFTVIYELGPAPEAFDYFVTRYVIVTGRNPAG